MKKTRRIPSKYSAKVTSIVNLLKENEIIVRFEKGHFRSSDCLMNGSPLLLINSNLTEQQVLNVLNSFVEKNDFISTSESA